MNQPIEINRESGENSGLSVLWDNQTKVFYPADLLRELCPCATCLELRGSSSHDQPLSPPKGKNRLRTVKQSKEKALELSEVWAVGKYAIGLRWADGHDTGIYSFAYLGEINPSKS